MLKWKMEKVRALNYRSKSSKNNSLNKIIPQAQHPSLNKYIVNRPYFKVIFNKI